MPLFITQYKPGQSSFSSVKTKVLGFYKHTDAFYFIAMRKSKSDTHKEIQAATG